MSERKILSKILRLDKNIYIDLINLDNALQKGILIYIRFPLRITQIIIARWDK